MLLDLLPANAVDELQSMLSKKRYQHCQRVLETAYEISEGWQDYRIDEQELAWAGLFHDCAKELKPDEQQALMQEGAIPHGEELLSSPALAHGPLGALMLQAKWGIESKDVLMAVAHHSTGHPEMAPIGWSIYLADYLEPGRPFLENREMLIQEARNYPLHSLRRISEMRIHRFQKKGKKMHPLAYKVDRYLNSIDQVEVLFAASAKHEAGPESVKGW